MWTQFRAADGRHKDGCLVFHKEMIKYHAAFTIKYYSAFFLSLNFTERLGTVDAEIKVLCSENPMLSRGTHFKAWGRFHLSLMCFAYSREYLTFFLFLLFPFSQFHLFLMLFKHNLTYNVNCESYFHKWLDKNKMLAVTCLRLGVKYPEVGIRYYLTARLIWNLASTLQ